MVTIELRLCVTSQDQLPWLHKMGCREVTALILCYPFICLVMAPVKKIKFPVTGPVWPIGWVEV